MFLYGKRQPVCLPISMVWILPNDYDLNTIDIATLENL